MRAFPTPDSRSPSLIDFIYNTPSQPGITRLVRHRPKPMSCMKRNIGQAITSWFLGLQICEFWSKFADSAALPAIPHTPTNPNRAKLIRALLPNMLQRSAQLRTKPTNPNRRARGPMQPASATKEGMHSGDNGTQH